MKLKSRIKRLIIEDLSLLVQASIAMISPYFLNIKKKNFNKIFSGDISSDDAKNKQRSLKG